jgi:hypothetical protein
MGEAEGPNRTPGRTPCASPVGGPAQTRQSLRASGPIALALRAGVCAEELAPLAAGP